MFVELRARASWWPREGGCPRNCSKVNGCVPKLCRSDRFESSPDFRNPKPPTPHPCIRHSSSSFALCTLYNFKTTNLYRTYNCLFLSLFDSFARSVATLHNRHSFSTCSCSPFNSIGCCARDLLKFKFNSSATERRTKTSLNLYAPKWLAGAGDIEEMAEGNCEVTICLDTSLPGDHIRRVIMKYALNFNSFRSLEIN